MTKQIFLISALALFLVSCGSKMQTVKGEQQQATPVLSQKQTPLSSVDTTLPPDISFAVALYKSGEYEKAQSAFEGAISSGSVNWQSFYYLGLTCKELKEYDHAKSSFQQALTFAPNDAPLRSDLYYSIGEISEISGNASQALLQYHMAVNLNPENDKAKDGVARLSPHSSR